MNHHTRGKIMTLDEYLAIQSEKDRSDELADDYLLDELAEHPDAGDLLYQIGAIVIGSGDMKDKYAKISDIIYNQHDRLAQKIYENIGAYEK